VEGRTDLFDTPYGTAFIQRTFLADEGRVCPWQDPDVVIGGLFPYDGRYHSRNATELDMQPIIIYSLSRCSPDRERDLAHWLDRYVNKARFIARRHKGQFRLGRRRK